MDLVTLKKLLLAQAQQQQQPTTLVAPPVAPEPDLLSPEALKSLQEVHGLKMMLQSLQVQLIFSIQRKSKR